MIKSKMQMTSETATDFWNDSCSLQELSESIEHGAVGATSNPVVVFNVVKQEIDIWGKVLEQLFDDNPYDAEEDIAWKLIEKISIKAAKLLEPVFNKYHGLKGHLSLQTNPVNYRSKQKMLEQALHLSGIACNIDIKVPCTAVGIEAIEEMTAKGVIVNSTVCFTLSQAIACAEAIERGLKQAADKEIDVSKMMPYVTINVGRLDDHLKQIMKEKFISIDADYLEWCGVSVFKKAYKIFQERGYRATLLAAAYRNYLHWFEFVGGKVALTIPYVWWNRYNSSNIEVISRIDNAVDPKIIGELYSKFEDFRRAYDINAMVPDEFIHYGATIKTLNQFVSSYYDLLTLIREKRLH